MTRRRTQSIKSPSSPKDAPDSSRRIRIVLFGIWAVAVGFRLDPRNVSAHNNLGGTLAAQGRFPEAAGHFESALALDPADQNARRNLERVHQMLARTPRR